MGKLRPMKSFPRASEEGEALLRSKPRVWVASHLHVDLVCSRRAAHIGQGVGLGSGRAVTQLVFHPRDICQMPTRCQAPSRRWGQAGKEAAKCHALVEVTMAKAKE